jgi:hypothetical protein
MMRHTQEVSMVAKTDSEVRHKLEHRLDDHSKFRARKEGLGYDLNKETDPEMTMDEFRDWVASRKAAAATIDIETCELGWWYGKVLDPYGLIDAQGDLPEAMRQIGTIYFVSSPDSGGWVNSQDLSPDQVKAMHARFEREYREREDLPF